MEEKVKSLRSSHNNVLQERTRLQQEVDELKARQSREMEQGADQDEVEALRQQV